MLVAGVNFWSGEVMKKRLVSILLAFCKVTQFVPTSALAAQVTDSSGSSSADVYTVTDDSDLAVPGDSDLDDSEAQADSDFTVLGGSGQNDAVAQSDGDGSNNAVVETGNDTGEVRFWPRRLRAPTSTASAARRAAPMRLTTAAR